jgi:hypothetical protein
MPARLLARKWTLLSLMIPAGKPCAAIEPRLPDLGTRPAAQGDGGGLPVAAQAIPEMMRDQPVGDLLVLGGKGRLGHARSQGERVPREDRGQRGQHSGGDEPACEQAAGLWLGRALTPRPPDA